MQLEAQMEITDDAGKCIKESTVYGGISDKAGEGQTYCIYVQRWIQYLKDEVMSLQPMGCWYFWPAFAGKLAKMGGFYKD